MQRRLNELEVELKPLSRVAVGVFCLLGVERLCDIYRAFADKFSTSAAEYSEIIDYSSRLIFKSDRNKLQSLKDKLRKIVPDSEEYSDVLADQAQCAAISLLYTLEYLESSDTKMALYAVQKIFEAIDIYGYEKGGETELYQAETDWQRKLLEFLGESDEEIEANLAGYREINAKMAVPSLT